MNARISKTKSLMISLEKVMDSVNRYLALQKIVELGSFTRAAEALGYT